MPTRALTDVKSRRPPEGGEPAAPAPCVRPAPRLFCAICAVLTAILLAGLYVPGAAGLFHFAVPSPALLAAGLGVCVAAGGWSGVLRALGHRRVRLRSDP